MSFTAKIFAEKSGMLWLVSGMHKGMQAWWFVLVKPLKLEMFKAKLGSDTMLLTDYGDIIESGYGNEPTPDDIDAIKAKGFRLNKDFE